jgi:hypothetical protein
MVCSTEGPHIRRKEAGGSFHPDKLAGGKETVLVGDVLPEVVVGLEPWDGVFLLIPVLLAQKEAECRITPGNEAPSLGKTSFFATRVPCRLGRGGGSENS